MAAPRPRLLFRGLHALVWHPDDANRRALQRYLPRLGLTVTARGCEAPLTQGDAYDLLLFDGDRDLPLDSATTPAPRIGLVGSETPTRLEWLLGQEPAAMLVKPIRPNGLYATLTFAFATFERRLALERSVERLEEKVRHRRLVVFAVLRLMRDEGCGEEEAFGRLRRAAMTRRMSIEALSAQLLIDRSACAAR